MLPRTTTVKVSETGTRTEKLLRLIPFYINILSFWGRWRPRRNARNFSSEPKLGALFRTSLACCSAT